MVELKKETLDFLNDLIAEERIPMELDLNREDDYAEMYQYILDLRDCYLDLETYAIIHDIPFKHKIGKYYNDFKHIEKIKKLAEVSND